ncbi:cytochrome c-type biogenesis protein [Vreelandella subglaciescola]|jgi:cytochrome c-type biogenesis protein CcmH|uniref:Cytochrome c-type biogenesis protein n=1 Tax=Vreelandella subglaciescola TaxID=29571 RepID=A0A1M7I4W3_9GAMM|nr:cytochrome c-type biogenesis protein [Halomonas subglaciescola]SHM35836.1 cytochrome c-type biogenesis protein CcmH [Halomonas subglaciescola]
MAITRWLLAALLMTTAMTLATGVLAGGIEVRDFDSPVQKTRYLDLTSSMRCPLCENQAIGDSDAPISGDMRDRVYTLLQDDKSDTEIVNYMVQRFGEYILYNPRLDNRTYLLWGIPVALLLAGALLVVLLVRARRNASVASLSADERARLDELINRKRSP